MNATRSQYKTDEEVREDQNARNTRYVLYLYSSAGGSHRAFQHESEVYTTLTLTCLRKQGHGGWLEIERRDPATGIWE